MRAALSAALASAGVSAIEATPWVVSTLRRDEKAGAKLKLVRRLDPPGVVAPQPRG